jgi:sec-independent protein translocase protein TatC
VPPAATATVPQPNGAPAPGAAAPAAQPPTAVPAVPEEQAKAEWVTLNPIEGIWVLIQIAIYAGLFISLPVIVYEICAFVFPGLKPGERRVVNFLVFGCGGFALLGICVAYFQVLPTFLPTLLQYAPAHVITQLRMSETVSLILKFLLAFGIAFQFPMVVFVLVFLNLLSPATLRKQRRIAIVIIAVAGAVLTPGPDPFSMIMMASALYVLYELSIWVSYFIVWRKRRRTAEVEEL